MSTTRRLLAVTLCAAALFGAACEADVRTTVTPAGDGTAHIAAQVTFTAELADQVRAEPAHARELEAIMDSASGGRTSRDDDGETITWTVEVPADRVAAAADLTGVAGLDVNDSGTEVTVELVEPSRLAAAIASVEDVDGAHAMAEQTRVGIAVSYPGGVTATSATGNVNDVAVTENADGVATYAWSVARPATGTVTVTGNPDAGSSKWMLIGGAAAAVAGAGWVLRRRKANAAN